jgi:hypothetical protein
VIIALLCALLLVARTYRDFTPVRIKLVTQQTMPVDGALTVTLPDDERLAQLAKPIVIVLQLQRAAGARASEQTAIVRVAWNDRSIEAIRIDPAARGAVRHDITLPSGLHPRAGDRLVLRDVDPAGSAPSGNRASPVAGWSLGYLEIANLHGGSHGTFLDLILLPRGADVTSHAPWWFVAIAPIVLLVLLLRPAAPARRMWPRLVHRIAIGLVVTLWLVALLSPLVSAYTMLLSFGTVIEHMLLVCASGLWRLVCDLRRALARLTGWSHALDALIVSTVIVACFVGVTRGALEQHGGNYSGMLLLSKGWVERAPVLAERPDIRKTLILRTDGGYDGQFMYIMTFDPLMRRFADDPVRYLDMVDTPPYRYGRIGFSWLTRLCSGGDPLAYPQTMIWLIVGSHLIGALLLAGIARHYGQHPAWALFYLAAPGVWLSLRDGLPESLAGAGLLAGFLCVCRARFWLAAIALAASLLIRETGLIFVLCLGLWWLAIARRPRVAATVLSAIVPFVLWRLYIGWRMYPVFGRDGVFYRPRILDVPFHGMVDTWRAVSAGTYFNGLPESARGAMALAIVVIVIAVVALVAFWKRRDALTAALASYALLALSLDYASVWSFWGNTERTMHELFLVALVALLSWDARWTGLRRAMVATFGLLTVYTLWFSASASELRALFWLLYIQL